MRSDTVSIPELTVNWHIREECNFACTYCYAKFEQSSVFNTRFEDVLEDLATLPGKTIRTSPRAISADRIRINFAGGEPFLEKNLAAAIEIAHARDMSPSFITNGSRLTEQFIRAYGSMISVAGISLDSFDA